MATNESWNHNDTSGYSWWQNNVQINSHGDYVSVEVFERDHEELGWRNADLDPIADENAVYEYIVTLVVDGSPTGLENGVRVTAGAAQRDGLGAVIDFLNSPEPPPPTRQENMMTTKSALRAIAIDCAIAEQRKWIDHHGSTRTGYIARYGSKNDPNHSGNGGEAIYAADVQELERLLALRAES